MGDFDSGLYYLQKGESFAYSNDERYLIQYDRAIIYFNKQDYAKALDCAKKAQLIKDDDNVRELIREIETLSK